MTRAGSIPSQPAWPPVFPMGHTGSSNTAGTCQPRSLGTGCSPQDLSFPKIPPPLAPSKPDLKSHLLQGASLTTLFKGTIPPLAQHSTSPLHLPIHCSKLLMDLVSYLSLNCQFHKGKNLSFVPSYVPLPAPCSLKHRWCTAHVLFNERKHRKVQGRVEYNCTARMWGWLS